MHNVLLYHPCPRLIGALVPSRLHFFCFDGTCIPLLPFYPFLVPLYMRTRTHTHTHTHSCTKKKNLDSAGKKTHILFLSLAYFSYHTDFRFHPFFCKCHNFTSHYSCIKKFHFLYLATRRWAPRLIPIPGYCEQYSKRYT